MKKLYFITFLVLSISTNILCQNLQDIKIQPQEITENSGCEITERELSIVSSIFKENALDKSYLILVARQGTSEKKVYNSKRTKQLIDYFVNLGIDRNFILTVTGESKDKFGYVEILVNGQLKLKMRTKSNNLFCTSCCEGK